MEKEFNLSEEITRLFNNLPYMTNPTRTELRDNIDKIIKEFIKRRNNKLRRIHLLLISNNSDDWDIASRSILDLINDKDKLAGDKLT